MIVVRREFTGMCGGTECLIWLPDELPDDFPKRLLNELVALAEPVGLGAIEAYGRRGESLEGLLDTAVRAAGMDQRGQRRWDSRYWFDYVAGSRIKVSFYEDGIPVFEDDPEGPDALCLLYKGKPAVTSLEFEAMYGEGALEGAVRLALTAG